MYQTIIATALGGLISVAAQLISNKHLRKIEEKKIHEKLVLFEKEELKNQKLEKKKILFEILQIINEHETQISYTKFFIDTDRKISKSKYDKMHIETTGKLNKLESIILLYFPDLQEDINNISCNNGEHWMTVRDILENEYNTELWKFNENRLLTIITEGKSMINELREKIIDISKKIQKDDLC